MSADKTGRPSRREIRACEGAMRRRRGPAGVEEVEETLRGFSAEAQLVAALGELGARRVLELVGRAGGPPHTTRRRIATAAASTSDEVEREALLIVGASDYDALRDRLDPAGAPERELRLAAARVRARGVAGDELEAAVERIGRGAVLAASEEGDLLAACARRAAGADAEGCGALAALVAAGYGRTRQAALGGPLRVGPERRAVSRLELRTALGV